MRFFLKTKDYSVSQEDFELRYDEELDMLLTYPKPENLDKYYDSTSYISHTDSRESFTDKLYHIIKKYNLKHKFKIVERHNGYNKNILDIGAGTGDFLDFAEKQGWRIKGIEPNKKAREKALKKGIKLYNSLEDIENQKFDIITLWHTLEHLPDLNNQINRLSSLLEENGTIIIAVPNYKSFDAAHYKNYWAAYDVPRHLWHFSKMTIATIFSNQGMVVRKIYPMIFDAFYVSLLSEKYKTGKQRLIPALIIGLLSNIKAWRSKEYSSLIYVIQKLKN
jgi:2-polyprenyl-3-methyl-5-hydroxy-6-metoxy-1,4-benzoquinol methylase